MGRPSNTDERREQIARALLRVMARRGYDGASVAAVAREAKLAPGLVHYHFHDKREILLAAIDELVGEHRARLDERLRRAGGEAGAQLDAFLDAHVGLGASADAEALACWVLISGEALREKQVGKVFERALAGVHERLCAIVAEGTGRGVFACADPGAAAAALLAAIQGYFVLAATARGLIPRGSALASMRGMARGLLGPGAAPPAGATQRRPGDEAAASAAAGPGEGQRAPRRPGQRKARGAP